MTLIDIDATLAAANPLSGPEAAALPLHDADVELVERLVAIPVGARPQRSRRTVRGRRRLAFALAAATAVAAAMTLLPSGDHAGAPSAAFAAPLVRFANASPLALLELPGWHVVYADEEPGGFGELHFVRGPADANGNPKGTSFSNYERSAAGRVASLTWEPGKLPLGGRQTAATGLGVTAHRFVFEGGSRRAFELSALFAYRGRELTFRASVTDMAMFRAELRALTAVDVTTWLRAMPTSVVKTAATRETVRVMLKGIPLPPGFDAARIRGFGLTVHDRYQLGAAVTGTIACMWIADWNHARSRGDTATATRAIAAMATAPRWPILREMASEGGWSQVLIGYARAMPSGTVDLNGTHSLVPSANMGLGCGPSWGVNLG